MKFMALLLFIVTYMQASNLNHFAQSMGFERYYDQSIQKARVAHKPLLIIISKSDCGWCRKFERETLESKIIKTTLQKNFVVLVVDKKEDKDHYPYNLKKFQTNFTPKSIFINPKTEAVLLEKYGYANKSDFAQMLDKILQMQGA